MATLNHVIVVGCQRSGTTLVGQLLGAHPHAVLIDETDNLYSWYAALLASDRGASDRFDTVVEQARRKYSADDPRFVETASGNWSLAPHVSHIVLKAPNLTYDFAAISRLDVPKRVIFPVRDPRAVVASMAKLGHIPMVENQVVLLREHPELANRFADELALIEAADTPVHVKRAIVWRIKSGLWSSFSAESLPVFRFRYEDLVVDPLGHTRMLAEHAGLEPDDAMLEHESCYVGFGPGMTRRERPVDTASFRSWDAWLPPSQQTEVLDVAGDLAIELGFGSDARVAPSVPRAPRDALDQPIVLVGRGGSGTRLLSELALNLGVFLGNQLNETCDSVEWVETLYPLALAKQRRRIGESGGETTDIKKMLRNAADVILARGRWRAPQVWGWKLPETMFLMPEVLSAFPAAKVIHILRHPVTSSLRRTHVTSRKDNPVGTAVLKAAYASAGFDDRFIAEHPPYMHNAVTWLYQVAAVSGYCRSNLDAGRYIEIRYEDLCTRADETANWIREFTGSQQPLDGALAPDVTRMRDFEPGDPRIQPVWSLCGEFARGLGYEMSPDGNPIVARN